MKDNVYDIFIKIIIINMKHALTQILSDNKYSTNKGVEKLHDMILFMEKFLISEEELI